MREITRLLSGLRRRAAAKIRELFARPNRCCSPYPSPSIIYPERGPSDYLTTANHPTSGEGQRRLAAGRGGRRPRSSVFA